MSPRPRPGHAQGAGDAVERLDRLTGPGAADDQAAPAQPGQVVGVGGLAPLEHHVVRGVDDVVDGPHAGQGEPLGDPPRRRADHHAVEARTTVRRGQRSGSSTAALAASATGRPARRRRGRLRQA